MEKSFGTNLLAGVGVIFGVCVLDQQKIRGLVLYGIAS